MDNFNEITDSRYGKMIYNINDTFVGKSIKEYGEWCQDEIELLKQVLKPGATVLDIGANIGTHALAFSNLVGKEGKILAFEPQRQIFHMLAGNIAINGIENIWCYYCAVSDKPSVMKVTQLNFKSPNNFGALQIDVYVDPNNYEDVPVILIDDIKLNSCDLIKVDVEGMEENVLRGAVAAISKFRPILYIENEREHKSESLISFIESLDYEIHWHITPFYNPDNFKVNHNNIFGGLTSKNMLCIPKERVTEILNIEGVKKALK